jgi:hypothetical protein
MGDADAVAHASGALAESYEEGGELSRADEALLRALAHETQPDLIAALLVQRISVLTKMRRWKLASEVLSEALALCRKHEVYDSLVDAHLVAGDANWYEGRSQLDAMRYYVAALAASLDCEPEMAGEVATHILHCLQSISVDKRQKRIRQLRAQLAKWIKVSFPVRPDTDFTTFLLQPFQLAERLNERADDWSTVPSEDWDAIIDSLE